MKPTIVSHVTSQSAKTRPGLKLRKNGSKNTYDGGVVVLITLVVFLASLVDHAPASIKNMPAPIKTLIVDGQNNHKWAETTPVLKTMMEACGRFKVDVSTCPAKDKAMSGYLPDFTPYDLVVVNDGYNAAPWPRQTQIAFEKFVSAGGGVVIYHAADNAWPKWKAYNEMIAIGGWGGRNEKSGPYLYMDKDGKVIRDASKGKGGGHGSQTEFEITVREPDHPITRGLPKTFLHGPDEMYAFLRGPARHVTILATAHSAKNNGGTGHEEPMLMTIKYGKGRIFHTVLGHAVPHIKKDSFRITYLRGAEWAATQKVTISVPKGFPNQPPQKK
ncbi:MAG: ThuA domain-containing protein [Phycisphaerae bacterium]|nr:ThuA domain-containing protein [Phycisphaerae bacterium]